MISDVESQETAAGRSGHVALVGRPNVGKSTLLNRLIGTKVAIVSDKPQTTRNRILGILSLPEAQVVFVDTPGVHRPLHRMNERMMAITDSAISGVDVVALVADVTERFGAGDAHLLERLAHVEVPLFLLLNKIDRIKKVELLPLIDVWSKRREFAEIHPISASSGDGIDELVASVIRYLPIGPREFPDDQASQVTDRFLAGEVIREKVLHRTYQEVPYATTVLIESYDEPDDLARPIRIEATILVEEEGQKGILIGQGGQSIKSIGIAARQELEELLGRRVHLELRVSQRQRWRDDERLLDRMGLPR